MTLAPVFRSESSAQFLRERGVIERLAPHAQAQRQALRDLHAMLPQVIDRRYLHADPALPADDLFFVQDHFFLLLFRSLFDTLGAGPRLDFYTRLNICIKGLITAADNLFDDEFKELIPLKLGAGRKFASIVQLMSFERLIRHLGEGEIAAGRIARAEFEEGNRDFFTLLTSIGTLEGSEESGVESVYDVEAMIDAVHRVRGGNLFALAFSFPGRAEADTARWDAARDGIERLGTAFQIVDDLTDFEFDLHRRSNNLLVSVIAHRGTAEERARLAELQGAVDALEGEEWEAKREKVFAAGDVIADHFLGSATEVLRLARREARLAFETLAGVGFWFDPADSDEVVHAIVGLEGVRRMESIVEGESAASR
ncbi:MAG: class 1 isoprenoid biosynthesis enzyme [Candidatus Sumerlaeia bacterium]|nr:class 1 isoprenoid biosynthesis enzyme [Candidatus Sumerlaeia bacterium]